MDNNNPNDVIPLGKAIFVIMAIVLPIVILVVVAMLFMFTDLFTPAPQDVVEEVVDPHVYDVQHVEEIYMEGRPDLEPGEVITFAGTGFHGSTDGLLAEFNMPSAVAVGVGNQIIVADSFNNVLRLISQDQNVTTLAGVVHTAGPERFPVGLFIDGPAWTAGFYRPSGIAVQSNRIFIADSENHAIRVLVNGRVYTVSGELGSGHADGEAGASMFDTPISLAVGPGGYLYVADTGNHVVRRISPGGYVTTIAGVPGQSGFADGAAAEALFYDPMGIIVAPDGRVFVADTGNHLIRVVSGGIVSTMAGSRVLGDLTEYDDGWDDAPLGDHADGLGGLARFNQPMGLDLWGGYLIVADSANHMIRKIGTNGAVTTLAGSGYPNYMSGLYHVAEFHFPTDVYVFGDFLFIADSGNNKIRLMRLE